MKTKKGGFYAALTAAVLILIAILVTACLEPITSFKLPEKVFPQIPENFVPTPGKGVVQFVIGGMEGRLIKPDVVNGTLGTGGFTGFDLYIYTDNTDGGPGDGTVGVYDPLGVDPLYTDLVITAGSYPLKVTNLSYPIELPTGSYFFKLDGFQYVATVVAATGVSALEGITADTSNPVTVELTPIATGGSGDGRFDYTFVLPHALSTANLTISSLTGGPGSASENLIGNLTGQATLPADYYRIVVQMGATNYQTLYYTDTLYIYEGMTSTASINLPALKNTLYDLSITFGDGRSPDPVTTATVTHGTSLAAFLTANTVFENPAHTTTPADLRFNGWYLNSTDADNGTNALPDTFLFIKNNLALYAGWTEGTSIVFTPQYTDGDGIAPSVTPTVDSFDHSDNVATITFAVAAAGAGYSDFSWFTSVSGDQLGETSSSFTLTITTAYLVEGDFYVTVSATHDDSGKPVNTKITVTVGTN